VTQQNDTKSDVTGLSAINDVVKAELSQYYGLSFALTAMAKMLEAGKTIDVSDLTFYAACCWTRGALIGRFDIRDTVSLRQLLAVRDVPEFEPHHNSYSRVIPLINEVLKDVSTELNMVVATSIFIESLKAGRREYGLISPKQTTPDLPLFESQRKAAIYYNRLLPYESENKRMKDLRLLLCAIDKAEDEEIYRRLNVKDDDEDDN
jgi:hypothetical protein